MEEWNGRSMRAIDQDFEEEDIWDSVKETDNISHQDYYSTTPGMRKKAVSSSSTTTSTLPRMIPRRANGNTSKATGNQSSAPMEIPDWSKIYGKKGTKNGYHRDHADHSDDRDDGGDHDNDDDDDEMVPPHEWIARKLARSQISSFSVCEGIGRTLKGRDLSKVRNAVLTKTGFLE
ncbi:protein S40-6-like [Humulus lupulus]|uniref:protein S40-6-like n=1 Tax=Humulus lupulus TaxID=3486 RepID=UPI002B4148C3|nr:protein S40-6-like [Humulus lupulus]